MAPSAMGERMPERKRSKRLASEITGEHTKSDTDTVPDTDINIVSDMDFNTDEGVDSDVNTSPRIDAEPPVAKI